MLFLKILLVLLALAAAALAVLRTWSIVRYNRRPSRGRRRRRRQIDPMTWGLYAAGLVVLLVALLLPKPDAEPDTVGTTPPETTTEPTAPPAVFTPEKVSVSDPSNWSVRWEIFRDGQLLHSYTREEPISFGDPDSYFALPGIATFRSNNHRTGGTYGTATVTEKTLTQSWTAMTDYMTGSEYSGSAWAGSGWTGQPLMVRWDSQTKSVMNLKADAKAKEDLVEVIYATLDGKVHFFDLADGSRTRDPIDIGLCFKGAGSLDPRGYPLLYVGAGDVNPEREKPRMFIISLIDGSILYEGGVDEPLSYRRDNDGWCAFDSAPLISAETDTLIWPGENGLLYTIDLNTAYDSAAGTISIHPDEPVIARYHTERNNEENYWYGYESSVCVAGSYLYVSENGGMFFCVDLNTMELVWAQDTRDDSNSTPVIEWISEEEAYIYTAPSLHWTQDERHSGTVYIYKLNALTGEVVWQVPFEVYTQPNLSGGIQATPLLGKAGTSIEGLILYPVARTPEVETGVLVALDTATGQEVWRKDLDAYPWTSPVAVYGSDGTAYVVACHTAGTMYLLDGATGQTLDTFDLEGKFQATPAVYENMLVVGNRTQKIFGIKVN